MEKTKLEILTDLCHRTGRYSLESPWPNLAFEESGLTRLAGIAGWVLGLAQGGKRELAESLAEDICNQLMYLNEYGGIVEGTKRIPRFRVVLSDDGTFGGFSLMWYSVTESDEGVRKDLERQAGDVLYRYRRAFNGGLLLHGFGEVFAVEIGGKDGPHWSIHT